jgi:DNA-binding transcriptional MerR regulator
MARLSKSTLRTVRFYEEAGILQPVGRTEGGHRVFERRQLERLMLVSDLREAGFSLEEIRELFATKSRAANGGEAAQAATASLRAHIDGLRMKIDVLRRLADDLERTVTTASTCLGCKEADLFPEHCDACGRIGSAEEMPRAMRVLWSLGRAKRPPAKHAK